MMVRDVVAVSLFFALLRTCLAPFTKSRSSILLFGTGEIVGDRTDQLKEANNGENSEAQKKRYLILSRQGHFFTRTPC